ncbi:hypothetical protein LDENG_00149290, partial [Lucifuga dentata]
LNSRLSFHPDLTTATASTKVLNKLQYIQNSAARLLTHSRTHDHITPVLKNLQELSIYCNGYRSNSSSPPTKLSTTRPPPTSLTSSTLTLPATPSVLLMPCLPHAGSNSIKPGKTASSTAAPSLWKHICDSSSVHGKKKTKKTHLF